MLNLSQVLRGAKAKKRELSERLSEDEEAPWHRAHLGDQSSPSWQGARMEPRKRHVAWKGLTEVEEASVSLHNWPS